MAKRATILCLAVLAAGAVLDGSFSHPLDFSGDVTMVSGYIWRGIRQSDGAEFQGTVIGACKSLSFGIWYSGVGPSLETDPYVELALPTGALATSIGAAVYSYDFKTFNAGADYEYELYARLGFGAFGLAGFYIPSQGSTEKEPNDSPYWLEVSANKTFLDTEFGLTCGYGTYSSRWLSEPKKEAVGNLVLTTSRIIMENISVSYNYSIGLDSDMDDILFVTAGVSF